MTRLLIADDHPLYRQALTAGRARAHPEAHVIEAADLPEALAALTAHPDTDLALLDLHMPGSHGLMGLASLRAEHPGVAVVMISAHDDPATIRRALAYGAVGYLTKRADLEALQAGCARCSTARNGCRRRCARRSVRPRPRRATVTSRRGWRR
jgi:DNA-binding NarL/FixJ family response regulator